MKTLSKIILTTALGLMANMAYALDPIYFPSKIVGLEDSSAASVVRSLSAGASAQFIVAIDTVQEARADEVALTEEINNYVDSVSKYFKLHPEFKGKLVVYFTLYPGYKTPFQYPTEVFEDLGEKNLVSNRNILLNQISKCNNEGFCSAFLVEGTKYTGSNDKLFENTELNDFIVGQKKVSKVVFTNNPAFTKPIPIVLFIGTNGYLISEQEANQDMNAL